MGDPAVLPADWIFRGGTVRTMNPSQPTAEAVAVRGRTIAFVGSARDAESFRGPATRIHQTRGAALFPGLIDAHAHVGGLGKSLRQIRLDKTRHVGEAAERVRDAAGSPGASATAWLEGRGWDQNDWPDKAYPTWRELEGVTERPVALRRVDGHALWVNRAALAAARIDASTPDPPGGKIVRDRNGDATGILVDKAMDLVVNRIPEAPMEDLVERLRVAMREMVSAGLTGAMDAGVDARGIEAYRALGREDGFLARVDLFLSDEDDLLDDWWARGPEIRACDGFLSIRGVKIYADGALGSRGAAFLADYSDDPGNRGLLLTGPERMLGFTRRSLDCGFDVAIHAIGDRGNRIVLDTFESALRGRRGKVPHCRVEHAQVLSAEDLPRFEKLGVIASMQPIHATSDMPWAEARVGPERIRYAYAWKSLLRSGAELALGSDFPVESHRPLLGLYAAVTRRDLDGNPPEGWYAGECLSIEEAVRGFTIDAARAAGDAERRGSIEVGKEADLVLLDRDLFAIAPDAIPRAEVLLTMTAGRVVYPFALETPTR